MNRWLEKSLKMKCDLDQSFWIIFEYLRNTRCLIKELSALYWKPKANKQNKQAKPNKSGDSELYD